VLGESTAVTAGDNARAIAGGIAAVLGSSAGDDSEGDGALPYILAALALVTLAGGAVLLLGRSRRSAATPSGGWIYEADERRRR
jgi:hypothetical protein